MDTAQTHYWSHGVIRQLLRSVRRPALLEREDLALEVKAALRCTTARDALLTVIRDALAGLPAVCSRVVELCDLEGLPTADAADALHIFARQLFRYRADAMAAIADEVNRVLSRCGTPPGDGGAFEALCLSDEARSHYVLWQVLLAAGRLDDV